MNPVLLVGTIVVNLALVSYAVGIIGEQRSHRVSSRVLTFLVIGVVLDVIATACMIAGSSHGPFTTHGVLGFSSLAAMLSETGFAWRHRKANGDGVVPVWLHRWSRVAFGWWLVAYLTGALLVMSARQAA